MGRLAGLVMALLALILLGASQAADNPGLVVKVQDREGRPLPGAILEVMSPTGAPAATPSGDKQE